MEHTKVIDGAMAMIDAFKTAVRPQPADRRREGVERGWGVTKTLAMASYR